MYFKKINSVTSILYMYVFYLVTTNYPKENIWHSLDREKYNCNEKK